MTRLHEIRTLDDILAPLRQLVRQGLDRWCVEDGTPAELGEALRYCTDGGKRLRGALVMLSAEAGGGQCGDLVQRAAVAVELIHAYSLVHDDLPAMDNDTLRRGQPTAHVKFGSAMAILTGDALLTRAFGLLAESQDPKAGEVTEILARAAGASGMIAGQAADMDLCNSGDGIEAIEYIHLRKTAALISASTQMGAIAGGAGETAVSHLGRFGLQLGLAFQLVDDLLDVLGQSETLGKTPGKDLSAGKRTHVALMGLDKAKELAGTLTNAAIAEIEPLGSRADKLKILAHLLTDRTY